VKAHELRLKSKAELLKTLDEMRKELSQANEIENNYEYKN